MDLLNLFWYDASGYHLRILLVPGVETFFMTIFIAIIIRRLIQG